MSFDPILTAPTHIQIHAAAAFLALVIGPFALLRQRRDKVHKILGYVWVLSMFLAATSSFFIHSFPLIGPFSPIHGLAILALWSLWTAMAHVRAGRYCAHAAVMRSLYWRGLMIAGLFNFLPGRTTNRIFFDDARDAGYIVIAVGLTAIFAPVLWRMIRTRSVQNLDLSA